MRKNRLLLVAIFCIIFATTFAVNGFAQELFLTATGGTMGGSTYAIATTIANIITNNVEDVHCSVQSTGGTVAQLQLIKRNESQIGTCDTAATDAFLGLGNYEDDQMPFLRAIAPMYPELKAFIVAKDSGIEKFSDLKGKTVVVGAVGSGTELTNKETFDVAGLTFDDIDARYLGSSETAQAFKDRQVDAVLMTATDPAVIEMTSLNLVKFVPFDEEFLTKLQEQYPKYTPEVIPAGMVEGVDKEVQTFACWNTVITREDVPEDVVYEATKALYENAEDLRNTSVLMKSMIPENLKKMSIPLHPGAKKFYVDQGYEEYFNPNIEK